MCGPERAKGPTSQERTTARGPDHTALMVRLQMPSEEVRPEKHTLSPEQGEMEEEEEEEEERAIFLSALVSVTLLSTLPNEFWKARLRSRNPALNKMQLNFAI